MPEVETITGDKLCGHTGLTDRRHRQLASEGYFPPPVKGLYQRDATLTGLFRYYREMGERTRNIKDKIDQEKERKLKLENDETEGRLTDTEKLHAMIAPSLSAIREAVYQKLEMEAPTAMATLDVPSARIIGRRMADELLAKWRSVFNAWQL